MQAIYNYIKVGANPSQLETEIQNRSTITVGCAGATLRGDDALEIVMKAPLSSDQLLELNAVVAEHIPTISDSPEKPALVSVVENEKYESEGLELSYRMHPKAFMIPVCDPGTVFRYEISMPCTVMLLGGTVDVHSAMVGDQMWFETLCPTTIGYLAQDTVVGQTMGIVNAGAGAYIFKGFDILIGDEVVGRTTCHSGDNFNMDTEWDTVYPAGTPIKVRYLTVEEYRLTTAPMVVWISRDTERGAIVQGGQKMAFFYRNNTGTEKWVQICLEYHT